MEKKLFTSESVSPGHPDKVCDQISDSILDACLAQDPMSRVACEVYATTQLVVIGGEISTLAKVDYEQVARDTLRKIGYVSDELGIGCDDCEVKVVVHEQSRDIAQGVDEASDSKQTGAGDQGIMFGYATDETQGYMPLAVVIAHKLIRIATNKRLSGEFKFARPDMKSQVTIDYTDINNPQVDTVLMSIQHDEDYNEKEFRAFVETHIIQEVIASFGLNSQFKILINPTGRFVQGGPHGDTGLTGRKIIVDTYGGSARHGGGAFSGKDATKVDRSAAYAARYIAKNIVAAGLAKRCEIQLSYAIGVAEPTSILVETFDTETVDIDLIIKAVRSNFDLTPDGIINMLDLRRPIFKDTAAYGHFGRNNENFTWEKLDKVEILKDFIKG